MDTYDKVNIKNKNVIKNSYVKLPLTIPPIKYLTRYYLDLAIAFNNENAKDWFCSSFMQMQRFKKQNLWLVFWEKVPFVKTKKFSDIETQKQSPEIFLEKILKYVCHGFYVTIELDWLYLRKEKSDEIFAHQIVIHGYDINREIFFITGYFPPKAHQISFSELSFSDFLTSFYRIKCSEISVTKPKQCNKKFSMRLFKIGIKSYYNSKLSLLYMFAKKGSVTPFRDDFGIKSHRYIRDAIENEKKQKGPPLSTTRLKGMEEFMSAMVMRLEYIKEKNFLQDIDGVISTYKTVVKQYNLMIMLWLKYKATSEVKYLDQITELSYKSDELEKEALKELISKF